MRMNLRGPWTLAEFLLLFPRLKVPALAACQPQCRENAVAIGTRVDADAIGALVHLFADRVTVDDKETVLAAVGQEGFADPAQVGGRLFGQGMPGRTPACTNR